MGNTSIRIAMAVPPPASHTLAVMHHSTMGAVERDTTYVVYNVGLCGFLATNVSGGRQTWTIVQYENVGRLADVHVDVLQCPWHPDRVYLVFGENQFLDTHGTWYRPNVWTGWRDNPPLGRQDIIDANNTQGAQNLWWVIEESMESIPGGPTFSIENVRHKVYLGAENGEEVWAYKKTAGEHPPLNQQWIFVPADNLDALVQELDAAVGDDAPL